MKYIESNFRENKELRSNWPFRKYHKREDLEVTHFTKK